MHEHITANEQIYRERSKRKVNPTEEEDFRVYLAKRSRREERERGEGFGLGFLEQSETFAQQTTY